MIGTIIYIMIAGVIGGIFWPACQNKEHWLYDNPMYVLIILFWPIFLIIYWPFKFGNFLNYLFEEKDD